MPKNILALFVTVFLISACQTTPAEEQSGEQFTNVAPSESCFEKAINDSFLHMCLNDLLEEADMRMNDINKSLHARASSHDEEFEKRAAIKDLSNSNLAFSGYREAECTRRAMLGETRQVKEDVFLGCKIDLTRQRIESFQTFN
jgi:uncharacterized protein YecT (DUF1311 family)